MEHPAEGVGNDKGQEESVSKAVHHSIEYGGRYKSKDGQVLNAVYC